MFLLPSWRTSLGGYGLWETWTGSSSLQAQYVWRPGRLSCQNATPPMPRRKTAPPRGILGTTAASKSDHARYHPSADLEAFVEHFWTVRWDLRGLPPRTAETLPHPSVHLVFSHDGRAVVRGVTRGKFSTVLRGKGGVFAAKFRPGGFYPFV